MMSKTARFLRRFAFWLLIFSLYYPVTARTCKKNQYGGSWRCKNLPKHVINVAQGMPAEQYLTFKQYSAGKAVDGNREGNPAKHSCAQTRQVDDPWWRVDLGKSIWVEHILIGNRQDSRWKELSNVEIRIGDNKDKFKGKPKNPLCRQGLKVPKEPWLYSCALPMLGRFVSIRQIGKDVTLTLCEVEVYVNNEAFRSPFPYLVPDGKGSLKKAYHKHTGSDILVTIPRKRNQGAVDIKVKRDKVLIDLPPKIGYLKANDQVWIPISLSKNPTTACSSDHKDFQYVEGIFVKSRTGTHKYEIRTTGNRKPDTWKVYLCKLNDIRVKADVCNLDIKNVCPEHSSCSTQHLHRVFPLGSYYCVCDKDFKPVIRVGIVTRRRAGDFVMSDEKCKALPPPGAMLQFSGQNLALDMKTSASSADDNALSQYAVDGKTYGKCFRTLSEPNPWLIINLDGIRAVGQVQIKSSDRHDMKSVRISIGKNGKDFSSSTAECAEVDIPKGVYWNIGCRKTILGDAVKVEASSKILHLCEVEVYSEPYANTVFHHITLLSTKKAGKYSASIATGRITIHSIKSGYCFISVKDKHPFWKVDLGYNSRVAVVFILNRKEKFESFYDVNIHVGNADKKKDLCAQVRNPFKDGKYFECYKTLKGSYLELKMNRHGVLAFCAVEAFPTRIFNVAGRRPAKFSTASRDPDFGNDHKIDLPVYTKRQNNPWWSVDLLVSCELHLLHVIVDRHKAKLEGNLQIIVGDKGYGEGRVVAKIRKGNDLSPIVKLPKNTKGRFVTVRIPRKRSKLQFFEVEVYNGPLTEVNECEVPNVCPSHLRCIEKQLLYTCECPSGFTWKNQTYKRKCIDVDECSRKDPCPEHSIDCKNTIGSFTCKCKEGFTLIHSLKENKMVCEDVDECIHSNLHNCSVHTQCINQAGSYTCTCAKGFKTSQNDNIKDQNIRCQDIDECTEGNSTCHVDATCSNTIGSYQCTCPYGMKGDGRFCTALKVCKQNSECAKNHVCKDMRGKYYCDCKEGYSPKKHECVDIDECSVDNGICGSNTFCTNTEGSYQCACQSGFVAVRNDGRNCTDIDECEAGVCGDVARCENNEGSYQCICPQGFEYDEHKKECFDIDECSSDIKPCSVNSFCTNTLGSFSCSCKTGYRTKQGSSTCTDIDECLENTHSCHFTSTCKNRYGGYGCVCKAGFVKTPLGACEEKCDPDCDEFSYCENGMCLCLPGYSLGPGFNCYPEGLQRASASVHLQFYGIFLTAGLLVSLALN